MNLKDIFYACQRVAPIRLEENLTCYIYIALENSKHFSFPAEFERSLLDFNMKRAASSESIQSKKVMMCRESSVQFGPFTIDSLPQHYYSLGNGKFAVVAFYADFVRIHIREYFRDSKGELIPTKNGITLSPILWQILSESWDKVDFVDLPSYANAYSVVRNELLLSTLFVQEEGDVCINMQRFFMKKDHSRQFLTSVCFLNERQWKSLKEIKDDISQSVLTLMFKKALPYHINIELSKMSSIPKTDVESIDAEIVLNTSLTEQLKEALELNICQIEREYCDGCVRDLANQLGHDCLNWRPSMKLNRYFSLAMCNINIRTFANSFLSANISICKSITQGFFDSLNVSLIVESVKKLYVANDDEIQW